MYSEQFIPLQFCPLSDASSVNPLSHSQFGLPRTFVTHTAKSGQEIVLHNSFKSVTNHKFVALPDSEYI